MRKRNRVFAEVNYLMSRPGDRFYGVVCPIHLSLQRFKVI